MNEETINGFLSVALEQFNSSLSEIRETLTEPSVLYKPRIYPDGNMWCCIYGEMPLCVVGFGRTPKEAVNTFNSAFNTKTVKQVDENKELEALGSRSCENCKYYRGIHKEDISCKYWGYVSTYVTPTSSMLCKEWEDKQ